MHLPAGAIAGKQNGRACIDHVGWLTKELVVLERAVREPQIEDLVELISDLPEVCLRTAIPA